MGASEKWEEGVIRRAVDFSTTARRQPVDWSGPTLRRALLGLEIGTSPSIPPVVVDRFRRTPHIALSEAFLALRASDCNGWPGRCASGQRRGWDAGRICPIRVPVSGGTGAMASRAPPRPPSGHLVANR